MPGPPGGNTMDDQVFLIENETTLE